MLSFLYYVSNYVILLLLSSFIVIEGGSVYNCVGPYTDTAVDIAESRY